MQALDNPFFGSLSARHRSLALGQGDVLRYPPQYAPFLGVAHANVDAGPALEQLLAPGESVYLLGVAPELSRAGLRLLVGNDWFPNPDGRVAAFAICSGRHVGIRDELVRRGEWQGHWPNAIVFCQHPKAWTMRSPS